MRRDRFYRYVGGLMHDNVSIDEEGVATVNGSYTDFVAVKAGQFVGMDNIYPSCPNCAQRMTIFQGRKANRPFRFECPNCNKVGVYNPTSNMLYQVRDTGNSVVLFFERVGSSHRGSIPADKGPLKGQNVWIDNKAKTNEGDFVDIFGEE